MCLERQGTATKTPITASWADICTGTWHMKRWFATHLITTMNKDDNNNKNKNNNNNNNNRESKMARLMFIKGAITRLLFMQFGQ
jgi:hypothetical protein